LKLVDQLTPSMLAEELGLVVRRMRRATGLGVVPMLVVEGGGDNTALSPVCKHGSDQIFIAGARNRVEELLTHLRREPIEGCECVYLVDCDGLGKTPTLAAEESLVVTEACDIEADLVRLGVAARVAARFLPDAASAEQMVEDACELALVISTVRRAAHAASVGMKLPDERQLRLANLPGEELDVWEEETPSPAQALEVIGTGLGWSEEESARVSAQLGSVPDDFALTCMGKDALDALFRRLCEEGSGAVRGWSCAHFHKEVFSALRGEDLGSWEVARRVAAWEENCQCELLES
jgi:hypothetical protein